MSESVKVWVSPGLPRSKEGWLTKCSIKDSRLNAWRPRYCVLREEVLYYFKSWDGNREFDAKNARGSIDLNVAIVQGLNPASIPGLEGDKKFCFSIKRQDTPANLYLFAAPSASDLADWLALLSGDADWAEAKAERARVATPRTFSEATADAAKTGKRGWLARHPVAFGVLSRLARLSKMRNAEQAGALRAAAVSGTAVRYRP